ncbi:MAG: hypothetical protein ACKPKO_21625, partial [Candidatus Fonsibacter sp.]
FLFLHCNTNCWEECCNKGCPSGYANTGCTCIMYNSYWKNSYVPTTYAKPYRGSGNHLQCANELTNIVGLCYKKCSNGYTMQSLGLCSQTCPSDTRDFGIGCIREAYDRGIGTIPLTIKMKPRK